MFGWAKSEPAQQAEDKKMADNLKLLNEAWKDAMRSYSTNYQGNGRTDGWSDEKNS